jgi:hypothetical protein
MEERLLLGIHTKKKVKITFNSFEKGVITRLCIPFDIGPSRKFKDGKNRYHFYDLNSPTGSHNLSILPGQLLNIEVTAESFNPEDYVTWSPNWHIYRDWGIHS